MITPVLLFASVMAVREVGSHIWGKKAPEFKRS